jgi:serine/threonine protein phosphatase PrpC
MNSSQPRVAPKIPKAIRAQKPGSLQWSACSDIGKVRKNNEDSFLGLQFDAREIFRLGKFGETSLEKNDCTFAVCDGMGGALAGEYASGIAVEKITTLLPRAFQQSASGLDAGFSDVLTELFAQIHRALVYLGDSYEECRGMQTTLSLCWFTPGWMYFGHIGDSRIYHLPKLKKELKQFTEDDTHVGWLFRNGQINEREARNHPRRNVLQRALGGTNQFVDPQVGAVSCQRGDIFLLCTDGLTDGLYDHHIVDLLRQKATGADPTPARLLVDASLRNSGRDNTTALVIQVV